MARLNEGSYAIAVSDRSPVHNFRLTGPGVNKATGVAALGRTVWTISLKHGKYHFQCDPRQEPAGRRSNRLLGSAGSACESVNVHMASKPT